MGEWGNRGNDISQIVVLASRIVNVLAELSKNIERF